MFNPTLLSLREKRDSYPCIIFLIIQTKILHKRQCFFGAICLQYLNKQKTTVFSSYVLEWRFCERLQSPSSDFEFAGAYPLSRHLQEDKHTSPAATQKRFLHGVVKEIEHHEITYVGPIFPRKRKRKRKLKRQTSWLSGHLVCVFIKYLHF